MAAVRPTIPIGLYKAYSYYIFPTRLKKLHYREFFTLLEQNIIIDIFQDVPLVFMAAILKIGIRIPLGILNGF